MKWLLQLVKRVQKRRFKSIDFALSIRPRRMRRSTIICHIICLFWFECHRRLHTPFLIIIHFWKVTRERPRHSTQITIYIHHIVAKIGPPFLNANMRVGIECHLVSRSRHIQSISARVRQHRILFLNSSSIICISSTRHVRIYSKPTKE